MSENLYQAPEAELVEPTTEPSRFFVVSTKKLAIMVIITIGLYTVYWFYRHYRQIKDVGGESLWPIPRALFNLFFAHNLFKRIHQAAQQKSIHVSSSYMTLALAYVVLSLIYNFADTISPLFGNFSLLLLPLIAYTMIPMQTAANAIQNDKLGESNSRFTIANYLWCLLGLFFWVVLILDTTETLGYTNVFGTG